MRRRSPGGGGVRVRGVGGWDAGGYLAVGPRDVDRAPGEGEGGLQEAHELGDAREAEVDHRGVGGGGERSVG